METHTTPADEVRTAYSDCGPQREKASFSRKDRCLDFRLSNWVSGEEAEALVEYIGPYNAFTPRTGRDAIGLALYRDQDARFIVAREGSVCLYIETSKPDRVAQSMEARQVMADEVMLFEPSRMEEGSHDMCRHDGDSPAYYQEPDTDPDTTYVRVWWD
jgi:hypothetical protein